MDVTTITIVAGAVLTAAIVLFALRGRSAPVDAARYEPVEDEIARYRTAILADTLCRQCGQANPAGAKYCYECGRTLPRVDAQEFDGTSAAR